MFESGALALASVQYRLRLLAAPSDNITGIPRPRLRTFPSPAVSPLPERFTPDICCVPTESHFSSF